MFDLILLLTAATPPAAPYLWAEPRENNKLEIDVTNDAGLPVDALFESLQKAAKNPSAVTLPVPAEQWPGALKGKKALAGATTEGAVTLTLDKAVIAIGASTYHLQLPTPATAKSPALVAFTAPLAAHAKLRDAQNGKDQGPKGEAQRVFAAVVKALPAAQRKSVEGVKKLDAKQVHFVPGSFAGNGRWLAWLDAPVANDEDMNHLIYAAILTGDGKVVDTIEAPALPMSWWRPLYLIDADGDGADELIGQPYYYEGASVAFYRWRGGKRESFVMTGDGA
jgi:hypothetical protein